MKNRIRDILNSTNLVITTNTPEDVKHVRNVQFGMYAGQRCTLRTNQEQNEGINGNVTTLWLPSKPIGLIYRHVLVTFQAYVKCLPQEELLF